MAYLAFDLDAKKRASRAARALGVEPGTIAWGLLELWEAAWEAKTAVVPERVFRGCFGPIPELAETLADHGFVEVVPDGIRVCGADRYLRITEARRRGGQAAKGHLIPGGVRRPSAEGLNDISSAPAESQPRASPGSPSAAAGPLSPSTEHRAPTTTTPAREAPIGGLVPLVESLYRDATGENFSWGMPGGPEERALRALEAQHGDSLPALLRAAFEPSFPRWTSLARLQRDGAGAVNECRAKASKTRAKATGPPTKGRATNADKDWSAEKLNVIETQFGKEWQFDE